MRALQTLKPKPDTRKAVVPGSIVDEYLDTFQATYGRPLPGPGAPKFEELNALGEQMLTNISDQWAHRLANLMHDNGFTGSDIQPWARDLSLHTTPRELTRMMKWATTFRTANVPMDEARDWWNKFTSPHWCLRYRSRGHTPNSATDVYWVVHLYRSRTAEWTPTLLETAHAWTMTRLPADRVCDYLRLNISPREALRQWEPRPDCTSTIAFMLALSSTATQQPA